MKENSIPLEGRRNLAKQELFRNAKAEFRKNLKRIRDMLDKEECVEENYYIDCKKLLRTAYSQETELTATKLISDYLFILFEGDSHWMVEAGFQVNCEIISDPQISAKFKTSFDNKYLIDKFKQLVDFTLLPIWNEYESPIVHVFESVYKKRRKATLDSYNVIDQILADENGELPEDANEYKLILSEYLNCLTFHIENMIHLAVNYLCFVDLMIRNRNEVVLKITKGFSQSLNSQINYSFVDSITLEHSINKLLIEFQSLELGTDIGRKLRFVEMLIKNNLAMPNSVISSLDSNPNSDYYFNELRLRFRNITINKIKQNLNQTKITHHTQKPRLALSQEGQFIKLTEDSINPDISIGELLLRIHNTQKYLHFYLGEAIVFYYHQNQLLCLFETN